MRRSAHSLVLAALASCAGPVAHPLTGLATVAAPAAPAAARPPSALSPPALRLGDTVRPTHYALDLTIVPTAEDFAGKVDIALELAAPTAVIWLHAKDLVIDQAVLESGGSRQALRVLPAPPELVGLVLEQPLGPGSARLQIGYRGVLSAVDTDGLFRQEERGETYVFSQFEPTGARRAFPCFDEPAFKVPFDVTVHARRGDVVAGNSAIAAETEEPEGMKAVRFATTRPLPAHLVALAVGPFDVIDAGTAGRRATPLRILTPRGRGAEAAYAARSTGAIVERLEAYFDTPYPYDKLDQVALPENFFGAMENPGLITYRLPILLISAAELTPARQRAFVGTAAHELAHQWFGNLVTLAWWDDLWLNEGFATWMGDRIAGELHPEWDVATEAISRRAYVMRQDGLDSARRIRQPIASHHDIGDAFDAITYGKGRAVLIMFEAWLGPERFARGIRRYLAAHADGVATSADLIAALGAEAGLDVGPALLSFLDQPGIPRLTVALRCAGAGSAWLTITQQRDLPLGSRASAAAIWQVPVCVKYGVGGEVRRECAPVSARTADLMLLTPGCPDWVMANEGGRGYYRVRYQGDLLERLLTRAARVLTPAERISLLDDALALADSGELPLGPLLASLPALATDPSRHVANHAVRAAWLLSDDLVPSALRPQRARLVRRAFAARAAALGWSPRAGEGDDARLLRPGLLTVMTLLGDDRPLRARARRLAVSWLVDRDGIDADLVPLVLGIAARDGDRALFDRLHGAARAETDHRTRGHLLGALGSFADPSLAQAGLDLVLAGEFEVGEAMALVWGALGEEATRELAYDFVKRNFDALITRLPREQGAWLIGVGGAFCDASHRADLAAFYAERAPRLLGGPRALAQTLEGIDLCIARRAVQAPQIAAFLQSR